MSTVFLIFFEHFSKAKRMKPKVDGGDKQPIELHRQNIVSIL